MEIDRRQFIALGGLAASLSSATPRGRDVPLPLDAVRVCNLDYYPAARRLMAAPVGAEIGVAFDYDPAFVEQASTGFWFQGEKVGDAPRLQREWFGRMIRAGRRLTGRIDRFRPASEYDVRACMVEVAIDLAPPRGPSAWPIEPDSREAEAAAPETQRFLRLVAEGAGRPPVFLTSLGLALESGVELAPGQPMRLMVKEDGRWPKISVATPEGEVLGGVYSDQKRLMARMLNNGVVLGAAALPSRWPGFSGEAAVYLLS